jgi:hypothetical protein
MVSSFERAQPPAEVISSKIEAAQAYIATDNAAQELLGQLAMGLEMRAGDNQPLIDRLQATLVQADIDLSEEEVIQLAKTVEFSG